MKRSAAVILILVAALAAFAGVAGAQGPATTVAKGLNGPMGVVVAPDGAVWVIDSGTGGDTDLPFTNPQTGQEMTAKYGDTARIVKVGADGTQADVVSLPSIATGDDNLGGARLALLNGTLYATVGQWSGKPDSQPTKNVAAIVKVDNGQVTQVASTWPIESSQNPGGHVFDTHPYGLTAGPDGNLWVADAGANDLLKVNPASGEVTVVAAFDGLPGPFPNPNRNNAMETDPVPTGVAFDGAGNTYVSFLSGFPFIPGSAKVVQVGANGQVSDYATGLTMLTDLKMGPDGNLYATQFGQFTETGPVPNSGAIIRIKPGTASEVVAGNLSFPTSISFNPAGDAYVAINGVGAPGSGEVVRYAALTQQAGAPLPKPEAPPAAAPAQAAPAEGAQAAPAQPAPAIMPATGGEGWPIGPIVALGLVLLLAGGLLLRRAGLTAR